MVSPRSIRCLALLTGLALTAVCTRIGREESEWKAAASQNTIEAYTGFLAAHPEGRRAGEAEIALGRAFAASKKYPDAVSRYEDMKARRPDDAMAANSCLIAKLGVEDKSLECRFEAEATGLMQPLEGPWGLALPVPSEFQLTGKTKGILGERTFSANIEGWEYLYKPGDKTIAGWGAVVLEGEIVIPSSDYEAYRQGALPYAMDASFDASPLDYMGQYVLLRLSRDKNHKFVVPVLTPYFVDLINDNVSAMAPGSTYALDPSLNSSESGVPTSMGLYGFGISHHIECRLFRVGDSDAPAGMRVDERGVRQGFGRMRMAISGPTRFQGPIRLVQFDPPSESAR